MAWHEYLLVLESTLMAVVRQSNEADGVGRVQGEDETVATVYNCMTCTVSQWNGNGSGVRRRRTQGCGVGKKTKKNINTHKEQPQFRRKFPFYSLTRSLALPSVLKLTRLPSLSL